MHLGLPLTPGRSLTPTGFDCETDGKFKVANTVFAEGRVRNYTNAQWEAALGKAKQSRERRQGRAGYNQQRLLSSQRYAHAVVG